MATVVTTRPRELAAPPLVAVVLAAGPVAVALAVASSGAFASSDPAVPGWAPVVALAALVAGVPHGAVDHLALVRSPSGRRRLELAAV
ncbi:hypothetical protein [Longivirga aurantiaca]|uniref:Beta-carotene 15,15'-dioxygenase n=1 Tax=Longivirga aurantiaca TaxID=1837743 RepID=A0ABW1T5Q9_9ACTN